MTSRYTVVHYVPDPIADERVNVGVIAWDERRMCVRFIKNWRWFKTFGGEDVGYLRDFIQSIEAVSCDQLKLPGVEEGETIDREAIERIVGRWKNSIQFSELRGSVKAADEVVTDVAQLFLRGQPRRRLGKRTRKAAINLAQRFMFEAARERVQEREKAEDIVKKNYTLSGEIIDHSVDLAYANGRAFAAVNTFSFEIGHDKYLDRAIDATAWTIDDVKAKSPQLPIAVFILTPSTKSKIFKNARHIFTSLKADVLTEGEMSDWAKEHVRAAIH